jgi:hypothetical protein
MPERDRSVTDMLVHANRLVKRSSENRLRNTILAYALFQKCEAFRPF